VETKGQGVEMKYMVKVAINIPSGKLICGNDFREQYPISGEFDVNEAIGIKRVIEAYGKQGLFHGFCGNSCPRLYLSGNKLSIASPAWDEKTDKKIDPKLGKRVGAICTDLWWYSVADYDDFIARGGKVDGQWDTIIDVKAGQYILSHSLRYKDWNELELYATIQKSGRKIVPWRMPEEGAIEGIMKYLPAKYKKQNVINVKCPKGADKRWWKKNRPNKKTIETSLYIRTAYKRLENGSYTSLEKKIGYEVWGPVYDGKIEGFVKVIVSGKQLQDYKQMAKRIIEDFKSEVINRKIRSKLFSEDTSKMDSKELVKHIEEVAEYFKKRY